MKIEKSSTPQRRDLAPWHQRVLLVLTNLCLFVGGAAAITIGARAALRGDATIAGIAWGAGALMLLGATVERFETLKGLGIEAKTRQIDEKLAEADDALERIRELSELTGANLIFLHSKVGRWDGPTAAEAYAVAQEVKANLTQAGSSEDKIRSALDPWVKVTCGDILSSHARELERLLQRRTPNLALQRSAALASSNGQENPDSLLLRDQLDEAAAFVRRLNAVASIDLRSLPDAFLKLYDEAPLVEQVEAAQLRAAALEWMPIVTQIRDDLEIPDPQRRCAEIDQLLERASRSD